MLHLTDLRDILRYVPRFRDRLFVICLDGAIVEDANFRNLLLDLALLRSLSIRVVLVHGGGHQIQQLAARFGQTPSNVDGTGVTDEVTLELSLLAIPRVTHEILEGLSACDLRGVCGNALVAHPAGMLQGVDHQFAGRIDRVEVDLIRDMLAQDLVPVIPPLGFDGEGSTYRLAAGEVAVEVAHALEAVKVIFITCLPGVKVGEDLKRQLTIDEADQLLSEKSSEMTPETRARLTQAIRAARKGIPRAHIIDGRVKEGLLAEVFSNEGIGTLIHANEYRAIRPAGKSDVDAIHALIQAGVEKDELLARERDDLESKIEEFYVFEVDQSTVACAALHRYLDEGKAEIACVCVDDRFENQGIGLRLMQYLENEARRAQVREIFCLSTQAYNFFIHKVGFELATPEDLPSSRREAYEQSGRRSRVLIK